TGAGASPWYDSRKRPPDRSERRRVSHAAPSHRKVPTAVFTSRIEEPSASLRSSADTGPSGLPQTREKARPSGVRKTPAVVTRTGAPNSLPKSASGVPGGAVSGIDHRSPPSNDARKPLKLERRSTVAPSGSTNAASVADGGRGSSDRRRTRIPFASHTPLSPPA